MTTNEQVEKKPRITELAALVGVLVSILIAGTSLLSNQANVPWWWFNLSFIILFALTIFIPFVIWHDPISKRLKKRRLGRKQNAVARRYFAEFKDLAESFGRVSYSLYRVLDSLRGPFEPKIKEKMGLLPIHLIQIHNWNDVESPINTLNKRFDESNKTFRDLSLLMDEFDIIHDILKKTLRLIYVFVREIKEEYPIPNNIEIEYEEFRDKYNAFLRDFRKYCHKVNQEIGERKFPEWAGDFATKW